jgi:hypothetical protein
MGSSRKVSGMIVAWEGCVLEEKKLHALEVPPEKKTKKNHDGRKETSRSRRVL